MKKINQIFNPKNKKSVTKLHSLFDKLNIKIDEEDKNKRITGDSTLKALNAFQKKEGLKITKNLTEKDLNALEEAVIKETYTTKRQKSKLHGILQKVNTIAKLNVEIEANELKEKKIGASSKKVIKTFQEKYKLEATGEINKATLDKLNAVARSKGNFVKKIKKPAGESLNTVTKNLRLNMVSPQVAEMQKSLSYLGYKISEKEFNTQTFGRTSIRSVKAFQKKNGFPQTGQLDANTRKRLNTFVLADNPTAATNHRYRIRGSVRNLNWDRQNFKVIKFFELILDQESPKPLGAKKNFLNGFFDIPYNAPINPVNGKVKEKFHLIVKLYDFEDQETPVAQQIHYNVNQIHWVNFTANLDDNGKVTYNGKYLGKSEFALVESTLNTALNGTRIDALKETENDKQITQLSQQTGLGTDVIMAMVLAKLVGKMVALNNTLSDEVFYAFIRQGLPADLPGDLLRGTSNWETIDQLTELIASGVMFLEDSIYSQILDNAIAQNLVSQKVKLKNTKIIEALQSKRTEFTLSKPILIGNESLKSLLDRSNVDATHYPIIASAFVASKGVNETFWEELKNHENTIGATEILDFTTTVEVGNISKNHIPTVEFLKKNIGPEPEKMFNKASDVAKMDQQGLEQLIIENNQAVPDNMPGDDVQEQVANFAAAMRNRAEFLYPAVSLIAEVKRSNTPRMTRIPEVEKFVDEQTDLNFRQQNIDEYLNNNPGINLDDKTKEELKIVQRVHKITAKAQIGSGLVSEGLHSSMQIYYMGKERILNLIKGKDIEDKYVHQMYESSKMKYMQIVARLLDFRSEVNVDIPKAIIPHTYRKAEIQQILGDIPNLEKLFGSLDYCECVHCKSLYSPVAYLTDLLRFLNEHSAVDVTKTVKDVLFERRPDIGNIKLNCVNTNTPLPYIDLVCEILENNLIGNNDFVFQTTLSQQELLATPQYVQSTAYTTIANADFPMNVSFNLWQEEARTYLNYLRVPRHELMEAFQDKSDLANLQPSDASIAAEYFSISHKENDLIVTSRLTAIDQNRYWGFNSNQTTLPVSLFLQRTKLTYIELLELLLVKFVNDPSAPPVSRIERPVDSCDTDLQTITNLSLSRFDLIHRFLRLWRKSGWKMWELDLLIRNPKIGNNAINGDTISNLKRFKTLQQKLRLPFEILLSFFEEINREIRVKADKADVIIQPLYNRLFQNQTITNPIDNRFRAIDNNHSKIPLDNTVNLGVNAGAPHNGYSPVQVILSSLALQQTDFDLLVSKTNNQLSVNSLSTLFRYTYLARSLKLTIEEVLLFLKTINTDDPFATLQTTIESIDYLQSLKSSGLSLRELDYVLNFNPDSSIGLRNESLVLLIDSLRNILSSNKEKIDQINLSVADRNTILNFDAPAIIPLSDAQLSVALAPLNLILNSAIDNFIAATFSIEETNFIINFDLSAISPNGKTELANQIILLQQNLINLLESNDNQIKSHVASSFGLRDDQAKTILEKINTQPGPEPLINRLKDEVLISKNASGEYQEINPANFPSHFNAYLLLHKIALVVSKMNIETIDLSWFIDNHSGVNTLDFSTLPTAGAVNPNSFDDWYNLLLFLKFKKDFPEPENASIRNVLELAQDSANTKETIFVAISELTQWDDGHLSMIHDGLNIQHTAGQLDYTNAALYHRLQKSFMQLKLTGVDASTMFDWTSISNDINNDQNIAIQTRQAIKSKYEQEEWLQKITPLHDEIREKKRAALVAYHLDNSQRNEDPELVNGLITNPLYWKDVNGLYKYFLIDVEMSACQLTSRIKQALSSIQLFVQRCFLNLENRYVRVTEGQKEDTSSPNSWRQWKWMKNYRVWEANRKIFFYPENWLEPELRDDKSPFFKELEDELLQNEVTKENAEEAFKNYLYKVDEVSHLEVCGLYHQKEDLNPSELGYEYDIIHVIGRTKAIPNIYYYRTYDMNYGSWTAWEKIDVDITGDHVVPVVYNRKLHLFWLQFMEKPMKTKKVPAAQESNKPTDVAEPLKTLDIQLGWSIKKSKGWTPKKISKQKLIHAWNRPLESFNLKPYYASNRNELYLDIYITTSREFNNGKFYDPTKTEVNNPIRLTKNEFNETYLPWHSSAFIFNGEVKDVKLKPIRGNYPYFGSDPNSFRFINRNFGSEGSAIKMLVPDETGPRLKLPIGMHFQNNRLTNNRKNSTNFRKLNVLEHSNSPVLLSGANSPFELVITQQDLQLNTMTQSHPLFYQDAKRAFFIKPEWEQRLDNYGRSLGQIRRYRFEPFYHPYTLLFIRELNRDGIDGLLNRKIQRKPESFTPQNNFNFNIYNPSSRVIAGGEESNAQKKKDIVDFSFGGANSIYNWELFFHAPLMVANRLMQNQKFEDAMHWFHYIFNPTDISNFPSPQKYWITKPFFNYNSDDYRTQRIESILSNLNQKDNEGQLKAWRNNPFNPHIIARYRPVAYQKNVVMKYLDNLIAWGDMLFKRDSIESINEASLLYMLAYEILGDRPQKVPSTRHEEFTFNELETKLDEFGNARVDVIIEDTLFPITVVPTSSGSEPLPKLETFYFCIPNNDFLSKYWDTVADRLFKIRHCMNIEGIVRQLPLFQPPIDPKNLVKAAAAGMDLGSVLNDLSAPMPYYRFRIVVQKAIDFCNEVKTIGEKLLSALEKKDAETMSLLRAHQEIQLLEAVKEVRKKQIDEATETVSSLDKTLAIAEEKETYYNDIPRMNAWEIGGVTLHGLGIASDIVATILNTVAGTTSLVPATFTFGAAGFGGSPVFTTTYGADNVAESSMNFSAMFQGLSSILHSTGSLLETQGSYTRRDEENEHQAHLASIEKEQIEFQITAAEIRKAIAEKELENQELQIEHAKSIDDYLRNKFTNEQLYSWMVSKISGVYFQSYQLAFDMAKKAEKCFQYELGITDSNIIQFGYWDSLKKGLLSGDQLMHDLRRLEAEYLNQNRREFEITKHISLRQMAPLGLMTLKETGVCNISLPEWLFDMDYPGQYMRRIKNISISIPCITGPYTNVNCTLSLLKNDTRMEATLLGGNYEKQEDDSRFKTMFGSISSIATSSAQNDSGMFELNFNDERYLPFEGAGAISDWQINLPIDNNHFDFSTISDVVLHVSYTSRNGGGQLASSATTALQSRLPNESTRLFSLRHEFSTEWHRFLHPGDGNDQELILDLKAEHYPFFIRGRLNTLKIKAMHLFAESNSVDNFVSDIKITNTNVMNNLAIDRDLAYNNVHHSFTTFNPGAFPNTLGQISIKIKESLAADFRSLSKEGLDNLYVIFELGT